MKPTAEDSESALFLWLAELTVQLPRITLTAHPPAPVHEQWLPSGPEFDLRVARRLFTQLAQSGDDEDLASLWEALIQQSLLINGAVSATRDLTGEWAVKLFGALPDKPAEELLRELTGGLDLSSLLPFLRATAHERANQRPPAAAPRIGSSTDGDRGAVGDAAVVQLFPETSTPAKAAAETAAAAADIVPLFPDMVTRPRDRGPAAAAPAEVAAGAARTTGNVPAGEDARVEDDRAEVTDNARPAEVAEADITTGAKAAMAPAHTARDTNAASADHADRAVGPVATLCSVPTQPPRRSPLRWFVGGVAAASVAFAAALWSPRQPPAVRHPDIAAASSIQTLPLEIHDYPTCDRPTSPAPARLTASPPSEPAPEPSPDAVLIEPPHDAVPAAARPRVPARRHHAAARFGADMDALMIIAGDRADAPAMMLKLTADTTVPAGTRVLTHTMRIGTSIVVGTDTSFHLVLEQDEP